MQEKEFDNLMFGKEAKAVNLNNLITALGNNSPKQQQKEFIKKNETPLPKEFGSEVKKFIVECEAKGIKNRTIRRMVKRKFNITVV